MIITHDQIRIVCLVGLAAANFWLLSLFLEPTDVLLLEETAPSTEPSAPPLGESVKDRPPLASLVATSAYPLFVKGRKPSAPAVSAQQQPAPEIAVTPAEAPDLRAVVIRGHAGRALLSVGAEMAWVSMGQSFKGWEIGQITPNHVELKTPERSLTIGIFEPGYVGQ